MQTTPVRAADLAIPTAADGVRFGVAQRTALVRELERLTPEQWRARTECPRWTVFEMAAHVASATPGTGNLLPMVVGMLLGPLKHRGLNRLDALNELGIDRYRAATPETLLADLRRLVARTHPAPAWQRRLPMPDPDLPRYSNGAYLCDCILPRDVWLHRHDIARAVGASVAGHPTDAEVVAQVVRDLALAWTGPDVVLDLTGPEGGRWLLGTDPDAPVATLATVEFLRHLSGRVVAPDLFAGVPGAVRPALTTARVTF